MAAERTSERYQYGSAAPARLPEGPVRKKSNTPSPLTKEEKRRQNQIRQAEENRRRHARFGGLYTLFIVAAVGITLFVCQGYLGLLNEKTDAASEIKTMKEELNTLKEQNNQKQLSIDTSIDYDYIYKVATDQLGMIPVGADQIKKYKSGESEYVIQFTDVPEDK